MIASSIHDGGSPYAGDNRVGKCGAGWRALIVEDETLVAWHLEAILQELGFGICEIVSTGTEAVVEAFSTAPDIIFMDVNLAGNIDGIEAAKQILERNSVPIVFITAYADDAPTIQRIRSSIGQNTVLGKPVTPMAIQTAMLRL